MTKKIVWTGGALFALLGSAACGGVIQPIGDGGGGSGGSNQGQAQAGSGTAQPHAGSATQVGGGSGVAGATAVAGSGTVETGACATGCSAGYGCYFSEQNPDGICAPFCDSDGQGQTADADLSCSNAVGGGRGTCVFSLGPGNPAVTEFPGAPPSNNVVTGLCSYECDPLGQDCPSGYTCDMTSSYSAVAAQVMYACVPNKTPRSVGDDCFCSGCGECGPGLTCSPEQDGSYVCEAYCDLTDPESCPAAQTCGSTEVTSQVANSNVGVCR